VNGPAPPLDDHRLAQLAREAGFYGENLVIMLATIWGESGADPDNVGDESITTAKWGPSIGLAQIRSLWAERGTGRTRDPDRLDEPAFNLRSAWAISSGGTDFTPWSVYKTGDYQKHINRARAAAAGLKGGAGSSTSTPGPGLIGDGLAGDVVGKAVEPLLEGLRRITLVGILLAGGVALAAAGAWKAVAPVKARAKSAAAGALS
jgi:hypothetical protein